MESSRRYFLMVLLMSHIFMCSCLEDEAIYDDPPIVEKSSAPRPAEPQAFDAGRSKLTCDPVFQRALDCCDIQAVYGNAVGIHSIWRGDNSLSFDALCHQDTDGAWMVIQRRVDGSENFNRLWADYKEGFGTLGFNSEFWFGLQKMHEISKLRRYVLRVELMDWDGNRASADYSDFYVDDENHEYTLHVGSFLGGTAGDSLDIHNIMKFTTRDQDNDVNENVNCGLIYGSGWWFEACHHSNLNGQHLVPCAHTDTWNGTLWNSWHKTYSMKETSMKIRPAA